MESKRENTAQNIIQNQNEGLDVKEQKTVSSAPQRTELLTKPRRCNFQFFGVDELISFLLPDGTSDIVKIALCSGSTQR